MISKLSVATGCLFKKKCCALPALHALNAVRSFSSVGTEHAKRETGDVATKFSLLQMDEAAKKKRKPIKKIRPVYAVEAEKAGEEAKDTSLKSIHQELALKQQLAVSEERTIDAQVETAEVLEERKATKLAQIIDGKSIAAQVRGEVKNKTAELGLTPGLGVILVGSRVDSATYVINKSKAAHECGFHVDDRLLSETATQEEVLEAVDALNADPKVHGILVQLPLPAHICEQTVLQRIQIQKDVDGFSEHNIGSLALNGGNPHATACTPAGVMELLKRSNVNIVGKNCVVLGRSNIVGTPCALMLMRNNGTVTICHSYTSDTQRIIGEADILIAAIGRPEFVRGEWLKEGCVVIDVGINSMPDASSKKGYKLVGDVNFEECSKKASLITPVPGGVGPMTIAMLLKNTLNLAYRAVGDGSKAK